MNLLRSLLIVLLMATSCYALPISVDNSESKYFPPVAGQRFKDCAIHAMVYYNHSYEYSRRVKEPYIFSPRLAWEETIHTPLGADLYLALRYMIDYGSPEESVYPYWENTLPTAPVRANAGEHKVEDVEYIRFSDVQGGINEAREALSEGFLLSFGTHYGSWQMKKIENGTGSAVYWVDHTAGKHCMTLVGYDDTLWVDINDNDIQEPQEMGCFKAVDGRGFYWIAYDSVYKTSTLEGAPIDPVYRHTSFDTGLHKLVLSETPIKKDFVVAEDRLTFNKWDKECNFQIKSLLENEPLVSVGDETKQIGEDIDLVVYELPKSNQCIIDYGCSFEGGVEYEIILKKKPPTNIVTLDIDFKDLVLYYQPELTQDEIDEGCTRPIGVVSSYAVYHATKKGQIDGGTNYKSGKAFHIYRPKIIDDDGNGVWANYADDAQTTKKLTIVIPQAFLDTAKYPVIVDPTMGDTAKGASCDEVVDQCATKFTAPDTGTITSVFACCNVDNGQTDDAYKGTVWTDNAGTPNTEVDQGDAVDIFTSAGSSCADATFSESVNLSASITLGTVYWLGFTPEEILSGRNFAYDVGTDGYESENTWASAGWGDSPAARNTRQYSIYATYTSDSVAPTNFPTVESVTETQIGAGTAHLVNMPATVNAGDLLIILFSAGNASSGENTIATPAGWTLLYEEENSAYHVSSAYALDAVGNEDSTTVDVVTGDTEAGCAQTFRITGWWGTVATGVEATQGAAAQATTVNPPLHTLSGWSGEATLWLGTAHAGDDDATISVYPSGWTDGIDTVSGAGGNAGCTAGSARREYAGDEANPGIFTLSETEVGAGATIAIRPAAAAGVIKTLNGLAWASVKTVNGLAVGSVKTINGAAAQ